MADITFSVADVIYVLSAIVLVGSVIALVKRALKPITDMGKKLDTDKRRLDDHAERIEAIENWMDEDKKVHALQNRALLNIINHMIDGNNVADMKKTRDDIIDFMSED